MLRCCISLRREISRMAVEGTPSSSCSRRIFLSAIVSLVALSSALYTTPYVPSPIFSCFSYCSQHARTRTAEHAPSEKPNQNPRVRIGPDRSLTCSIASPNPATATAAGAEQPTGEEAGEGWGRNGRGLGGEGEEVGKGGGGRSCSCH